MTTSEGSCRVAKIFIRIVRAGLLLAVAGAFASGVGCGSGGGGGDGAAPPQATRTAVSAATMTPPATATPVVTPTPRPATTESVAFTITTGAALQAFQFRAAYPTAKGSFAGSADQVSCSTAASGAFTRNDRDDGTLILSIAAASELSFPIDVRCTFDVVAGQSLAAGEIDVAIDEVTTDGAAGDASALEVVVAIP